MWFLQRIMKTILLLYPRLLFNLSRHSVSFCLKQEFRRSFKSIKCTLFSGNYILFSQEMWKINNFNKTHKLFGLKILFGFIRIKNLGLIRIDFWTVCIGQKSMYVWEFRNRIQFKWFQSIPNDFVPIGTNRKNVLNLVRCKSGENKFDSFRFNLRS